MSTTFEIPAEIREDAGKGASRRLRHAGKVPAIVYGGDREPVALTLEHNFLLHASEDEAFYSSILKLKVGKSRTQSVVLRDIQRHPARLQIMHVDFQRILDTEVLRLHVPLHFINEDKSMAGKSSGVVISHLVTDVEVACLPKDLPEFIEVDLESMDVGDIVLLSDIKLPEGVEIPALATGEEADVPVVTAGHVTTGASSEATDDEADEGEVIGGDVESGDSE